MKKTLLFLLFISCGLLAAETWTVLVYMAADNNLAYNGKLNINEMESATQPTGLNLIVQADFPDDGAKRYRIQADQDTDVITSPVLETLGSIDSGDPQTLKDFILWGRRHYPADSYMLVIWAHGDSWYKASKWIAPDYDTGSMIGVANGELGQALMGTGVWDILLFDACSMQGLEILTAIKDLADYVVASADLVPDTGFPYAGIIPLLDQNPHSVAAQIPDLYIQSYLPGGINNPSMGYFTSTCSAISTSGFAEFQSAWKGFCAKLRNHTELLLQVREELFEMNTGYADIDVRQLLVRLAAEGISEAVDLLELWNTLVVASAYTLPYPETDIGTAALWFPDSRFNYDAAWQHYMKLDFTKTGWLGVVNQSLGEPLSPPEPPSLISQNVLIDRLILSFAAPLSPDSLYYRLILDGEEDLIFPAAYSSEFSFAAVIADSGSFSISAIDQNGLESEALKGSFSYVEEADSRLIVYPNPAREAMAAKLIWKHKEVDELTVSVYNLKGQRVLRQTFTKPQVQGELPLMGIQGMSKLKRGIYFIRLRQGSQTLQCKLTIL